MLVGLLLRLWVLLLRRRRRQWRLRLLRLPLLLQQAPLAQQRLPRRRGAADSGRCSSRTVRCGVPAVGPLWPWLLLKAPLVLVLLLIGPLQLVSRLVVMLKRCRLLPLLLAIELVLLLLLLLLSFCWWLRPQLRLWHRFLGALIHPSQTTTGSERPSPGPEGWWGRPCRPTPRRPPDKSKFVIVMTNSHAGAAALLVGRLGGREQQWNAWGVRGWDI